MVVFAQVVEQGTLSGAARHLSLSRAVVSYHIKKLNQLGIKLLNRSTRTISNPSGKANTTSVASDCRASGGGQPTNRKP